MNKSKIEKNLTEGNVARQLILFSLPLMLSNLIQTIYNVADMLIVGNYMGSVGISGVNIGGQVTFILTNIVIGFSVGGTVIIAQYLGSGDRKGMNETISTLLSFLLVSAVFFTVVMILLSDVILRVIQTPAESYEQARSYLNVTLLGTIFIFGYNAFSAILRGLGDSKRPLIFVSIACFTNIILDFLFVGVFHMESRGAALATIISQAFSMICCIIYLKKSGFDLKLGSLRFYKQRFFMLMRVGIPVSIQNVIINFSFLFLTAISNGMGVSASAALGVVAKYNGFAILPAIAVGSSVSAMVAQNMGAGMADRAKKTLHTGFFLAFSVSLAVYIITNLFPEQILGLFGDDPDMIANGVDYIRTLSLDYLIVPATFCLNGLITGSGHTIVSSISGIMSSIGFRIPFAVLFGVTLKKGMRGLGMAAPIASLAATILVFCYYMSGKWKVNKVVKTAVIGETESTA